MDRRVGDTRYTGLFTLPRNAADRVLRQALRDAIFQAAVKYRMQVGAGATLSRSETRHLHLVSQAIIGAVLDEWNVPLETPTVTWPEPDPEPPSTDT